MKRIIAFVLLGIVIYAGIFTTVYGIKEYLISMNEPITLNAALQNDLPVKDKVSRHHGVLRQKTNQAALFGIPIGDRSITYFYVIPVGEKPNYMLLGVTDPEDIEALENTTKGGGEFAFTGVLKSMDPTVSMALREYLVAHPGLIGTENKVFGVETIAANHVVEYAVYVRDIKGPDAVPIIVGAAITIAGAGLAALLAVRIIREKTGY